MHLLIGQFSFPVLTFSRVIHAPDNRDLTGKLHNIEHFTLVRNLTNWHIKLIQREAKYDTQNTRKVNDNVFLWFVMGISDISKLESMPKTQEYQLKAPHKVDLERRRKIMLESINDSIFPVAGINHNPISPYFINFEFFVSNRKTKELNLPEGVFHVPSTSSKREILEGGIRFQRYR